MNPSDIRALGLEMPTPMYVLGIILFSIVGFWAWRRGKKKDDVATRWLGFTLMVYPYAVSSTWLLWIAGIILCAAVWWFME